MRIQEFDELKKLRNKMEMEKSRLIEMQKNVSLIGGGSENDRVDTSKENGTEKKYINIISRQEEQIKNVKEAVNEYYALERKIFNKIKLVGKLRAEYSVVLYNRFVQFNTQEQTAQNIGYSLKHTQHIQKDALIEYSKLR